MRAAKVKDPGPKGDERLPSATKSDIEVEDPLQKIIEAYNAQPHTPELITQTFQTIWQIRGESVDINLEVTQCPYTQEELADLEAGGKRVGYLPTELSLQQTRHILGKMFPKMTSYGVQENNPVTNDENPSGWFDYEVSIGAPYLDTEEGELMDRISKDGRKILSLNQYIVAGQDSKLFTGQYLDEVRTWVRLGSRDVGRVVSADFNRDGYLGVGWGLGPDGHDPDLGGRSSGVKKA